MDNLTAIVVLIPTVLNLLVSGIYAYIAFKKSKEPPKDEVWDTTSKIMCARSSSPDTEEFAQIYEELRWFKDHGCSLGEFNSLYNAVRNTKKQSKQPLESDS